MYGNVNAIKKSDIYDLLKPPILLFSREFDNGDDDSIADTSKGSWKIQLIKHFCILLTVFINYLKPLTFNEHSMGDVHV